MADQIIDGTGSGYLAAVTANGEIRVTGTFGSGAVITAGSLSIYESPPTDATQNNPEYDFIYMSSGTATGITTGSAIGSIIQYIGAGSYVSVWTYSSNNLTNIGSYT